MNKDTYKLYYFGVNGRGGPIRALLRYAKVAFENNLISDQWPAMKASGKFEYGQMPGLEINGKMYVQSNSILRYLARKFDLMGKTPEDEYEINNVLDSFEDLYVTLGRFAYPVNDEMKKEAEKFKKEFVEKVKQYLAVYQKKWEAHGKKKHLLGDHFTLADIQIPIVLLTFSDYMGGVTPWKENAPEVLGVLEKSAHELLKDFYAKDVVVKK